MHAEPHQSKQYLWVSIFFHVIILAILIVSAEFSGKIPVVENSIDNTKIVNAMVVADAPPMPKAEIPKPAPLKAPQPVIKNTPKIQPKVEPKLESKSEPKPILEKKPVTIAVKPKAIALEKPKVVKEKIRKQKEIEAAFAKELAAQREKSLQQDFLKESQRVSSARAQGEVNKYKALILQAISEHWLVPSNVDKKLVCELLIRLAPGGMVMDVQLVKGSGNPALDSSARAAVFKASPLPVPKESQSFEPFRQFVLKVRPENVLEKITL